jgi:hypothetical protein
MMPALPADPAAAATRRARVQQAAAEFAGATVHEYVGGDHDLHAQQPDQVADDLLVLAAAVGDDGPRDDAGGGRVLERRD